MLTPYGMTKHGVVGLQHDPAHGGRRPRRAGERGVPRGDRHPHPRQGQSARPARAVATVLPSARRLLTTMIGKPYPADGPGRRRPRRRGRATGPSSSPPPRPHLHGGSTGCRPRSSSRPGRASCAGPCAPGEADAGVGVAVARLWRPTGAGPVGRAEQANRPVTYGPCPSSGWGSSGRGSWARASPRPAAVHGFEVVLRSRAQSTADAMVAAMEKSLAKQVDKGKLAEADRDAAMARVTAVSDLGDLAGCDLVIESVVEDLGRQEAPLLRARPHLRRPHHPGHQHLHPARWWRWPWRRAGPTRCAASTSSTPPR